MLHLLALVTTVVLAGLSVAGVVASITWLVRTTRDINRRP